ncbi:MAG: hypothetical protein ACT4PP_14400 [Sporichthyaceae bacterium]
MTSENSTDLSPGDAATRVARWRLGGVIALVAALVVTVVVITGRSDDKLSASDPTTVYGGLELTVGQKFTMASFPIDHPGAELRMIRVEALTSPNVEYVGAYALWPRDLARGSLAIAPGFPAKELRMVREFGAAITAEETLRQGASGGYLSASVAIGFRLVSGDVGAVNGIRVVYTVNGRTRHMDFRHAATICASKAACKAADDSKWSDDVLRQFDLVPGGN